VREARRRSLDVSDLIGNSEQVCASTDAAEGIRSSAPAGLLVPTWPSTRTGLTACPNSLAHRTLLQAMDGRRRYTGARLG
jgi:hypothetical protein